MGYKALNRIEVMRNKKKIVVAAGTTDFEFNDEEIADLEAAGAIDKTQGSSSASKGGSGGGKPAPKKPAPKKEQDDDLGLGEGQK